MPMKTNKIFTMLLMLLTNIGLSHAQEIKSITMTFNEKDFVFTYNNTNELTIHGDSLTTIFKSEESSPGLPYIPINVLVPSNSSFTGVTSTTTKQILKKNVNIAPNPKQVPTNQIWNNDTLKTIHYSAPVYPTNNVEYTGTNIMGGYTIMSFMLCPFEYDAIKKCLYLINNFNINIKLQTENASPQKTLVSNNSVMQEVVKSIVVNGDDIYSASMPNAKTSNSTETFEYVIITSQALAEDFNNLINWKKTKGVTSKIITTEYINENYEGNSLSIKIKSCLLDYYQNHDLKYVLLGGDETIVPVVGCYAKVDKDHIENKMPTDMFYACFDGDFEWNADGDNIIGEINDNVNLTPSIFVTRIPVRTSDHASAFVSRQIMYERQPRGKINNTMLMCGVKMFDYAYEDKNISDAEAQGDYLYNVFIEPHWKGEKKKFYDTGTDFPGGKDYILSANNLQDQLSHGYTFVDMLTHGYPSYWSVEIGSYQRNMAQNLKNNGYTVIVTSACHTNAFDNGIPNFYDPCLSESFIRNRNSGIIAYLGCSREGWGSPGASLGTSTTYESKFYQYLFSDEIENKNYGTIVAAAKAALIPSCSSYDTYRWIQFGLNPIGDPEMQIYTDTPQSFSDLSTRISGNYLYVDTGIVGCNICAKGNNNDENHYEVRKNSRHAIFNIKRRAQICVTKQNYSPTILRLYKNLYFQNENVSSNQTFEGFRIKAGSSVTTTKPFGNVTFDGKNSLMKGGTRSNEDGTSITKNSKITMSNK